MPSPISGDFLVVGEMTTTIYLDHYVLARALEMARLRAEIQKLKEDKVKLCRVIHLVTETALAIKKENNQLKEQDLTLTPHG